MGMTLANVVYLDSIITADIAQNGCYEAHNCISLVRFLVTKVGKYRVITRFSSSTEKPANRSRSC